VEISLLAVGKLRSFYREACDEYLRRLQRYGSVEEVEIRESRRTGSIEETNLDESRALLEKLPPRATVISLSRIGTPWSSAELAERLDRWMVEARPLVFAIGGSTGLDDGFLARSQFRWSLGPLTLPHELARVVVCEQLYRAFTILRGEPYHKGRA
jgi:23S rRNA (pseudouridine1915-N3)-methyltransferase